MLADALDALSLAFVPHLNATPKGATEQGDIVAAAAVIPPVLHCLLR